MAKQKTPLLLLLALSIWLSSVAAPAAADPTDVTGQWYGTWEGGEFGEFGGQFEMLVLQDGPEQYWAVLYIPELGLFDVPVPMVVTGDQVDIGDPQFMWGAIAGDSLSGIAFAPVPFPPFLLLVEWQAQKQIADVFPGPPPGPQCEELPPLYCTGSAEDCSELLPFLPEIGPGYLNYPINGETWEDQYRSYVRRDLMQLVKYAAAKVECEAADWDYGNFAPLGLGDMSEADGSIPGTSVGNPGHPPGTHEDGNDMDIAYYQLYAADNLLRPVGRHHDGYFDAYHCTGPPYMLDMWRTALFITYLSKHPHVRAIGVDGQVGLMLEEAFYELELFGWIDADARATLPLYYEVTDEGRGWYQYHHQHLHVSMNLLHPIVSEIELQPNTLNKRSRGKYVTGHIELVEGYDAADIDLATVALIVNGHTILYAEPGHSEVSDYNDNGVADLTVKFDRRAVTEAVGTGTVEMAITGSVDGMFFQDSDTIRTISR